MKTIATRFSHEMSQIAALADMFVSTFELAKLTARANKHQFSVAANDVHAKARAVPHGAPLAFEGTFLCACAMYEEAVRDLIDEATSQIAAIKPAFSGLPPRMQERHLDGCVEILRSIKNDKFKHLTPNMVVASMASCHAPGPGPAAYSLVTEAFSSHTSNFRAKIVKETVARLGLEQLWSKLGTQAALQAYFKTTSAADAERFSMARLDAIMDSRNLAIHRGTAFVPPTHAEVTDSASFLAALVESLANTLDAYVKAL